MILYTISTKISYNSNAHMNFLKKLLRDKRKKKTLIWILSVIGVYLLILIYFTNPFNKLTIVRSPYQTTYENNEIVLQKQFELNIEKGFMYNSFGFIKSGIHIVANVYIGSKKALNDTTDLIIEEIYEKRFNPRYPYLISGDHFSVLYPRSLGIFYLSALDPRILASEEDWVKREKIILQTTAYIIDVFNKNGQPCTTIVPIGPKSVTCINVYAYPSDAVYSVLYALRTMETSEDLLDTYLMDQAPVHELHTTKAAKKLVDENKEELELLIKNYKETVFDYETGLIKKDIHISGTKDIIRRESAFYDNVIYWKTLTLGNQLGITEFKQQDLDQLKKRIITTYWYEKGGYFLEDLSEDSIKYKYYSSDWLVVLFTQFLDPSDPMEREYYEKSVAYIRKEKLAEPFGLKYQQDNRASRAFLPVRLFVRSYGGTAIWSFWGTEYMKLLSILHKETGNTEYQTLARQQLKSYEENILKYKGFPEVYDKKGNMLSNIFYKSVRQTGWVINFEQARLMLK